MTALIELLLNVVWLVLALVSLALWGASARLSRRHGLLTEFFALSCALLVLFPAISLTDDLHESAVVVEECVSRKGTIQKCKAVRVEDGGGKQVSAGLLAAIPLPASFLPEVIWSSLTSVAAQIPNSIPQRPFAGRAPPPVLL